jgi:hypothetical protein
MQIFDAVTKTINPINIADKLTSFIRRDDDKSSDGKPQSKIDLFRIAVAIEGGTAASDNVNSAEFRIALVDRKTAEHVSTCRRTWETVKNVVTFVRSVAPKLDIPPLPLESSKASPAVVLEGRRKFVQTYLQTALSHPTVCNLKEVHDLIGYTEYQSRAQHERRTEQTVSRRLKKVERPPETVEMQASPRGSFSAPLSSSESLVSPPSPPRTKPPAFAKPEADLAEECFRLLDEGGAGYLAPEDMKEFLEIVARRNTRTQNSVSRILKEQQAMNASEFTGMVRALTREANISLNEWATEFKHRQYRQVFSAIAAGVSKQTTYDEFELRCLIFVLRISGIRLISEAEVMKEEDLVLPVSFDGFCELMDVLTVAVATDVLFKSLEKTKEQNKFINAVNKAAATVPSGAAAEFQSLIESFGGGMRRAGKCGSCEATEQRLRAIKIEVTDLSNERDQLVQRVRELEQLLADRDARIEELIEKTIVDDPSRFEQSQVRIAELESQIADLEAREGVRQPLVHDSANYTLGASITMVQPSQLGSSNAPVIDLPGCIFFKLSDTFIPNGFAVDLLLCEVTGCEYLACRDRFGRRSLCWTLENGEITLPWTPYALKLPFRRWIRLHIAFHWESESFDVSINGKLLWSRVPARDAGAAGISQLDVFPREEVLICYANMHFYERSG